MKQKIFSLFFDGSTLLLALLLLLPAFPQKKAAAKRKQKPFLKEEFKFSILKPPSVFWTFKDKTTDDEKQSWVDLSIKRSGDHPLRIHFHAIMARYYSEMKGISDERENIGKILKEVLEEKEGKKKFKKMKGYWLYAKGKNKDNQIITLNTYIFKKRSFVYFYRVQGREKELKKYAADLKFIEKNLKILK